MYSQHGITYLVSNYTTHSIIHYVIRNSWPPQMQMWPPHWPPQTAAARNAPGPAQLQQLVIGCMTHTAPSDRLLLFGAGYKYSLLTYLPCRVLEYSIRLSTEYSSSKNLDSPNPIRWSPHLGCLLLVCRCARCARCEGCARCRG